MPAEIVVILPQKIVVMYHKPIMIGEKLDSFGLCGGLGRLCYFVRMKCHDLGPISFLRKVGMGDIEIGDRRIRCEGTASSQRR